MNNVSANGSIYTEIGFLLVFLCSHRERRGWGGADSHGLISPPGRNEGFMLRRKHTECVKKMLSWVMLVQPSVWPKPNMVTVFIFLPLDSHKRLQNGLCQQRTQLDYTSQHGAFEERPMLVRCVTAIAWTWCVHCSELMQNQLESGNPQKD